MRRIADVKSRLQRTNPVDHALDYNRMFGELVALEQHRRNLRDQPMKTVLRSLRRTPPSIAVAAGERVLASCHSVDGRRPRRHPRRVLRRSGRRDRRVPWEQVEAADWDRDTAAFRLSEVGTLGRGAVVHSFTLDRPGRLLELVRERVTASVVLQRHVALAGRRGLRVIARRAPRGTGEIEWIYEYDEGVDPDDPAIREATAPRSSRCPGATSALDAL